MQKNGFLGDTMKKIGILTVTGDNNYGNKLQNYAMESLVRELGCDVQTIRVEKESYHKRKVKTYIQYMCLPLLPSGKKKRILRRIRFYQFNKHITQGKVSVWADLPREVIEQKLAPFDYLIYGSDQIWNPEFPQFSEIFLGGYAPKEKNIAVSASMGLSEIPEASREVFEKGLKNFKAISVREDTAKSAIEQLNGDFRPVVLPDPTLVLEKDKWTAVEQKVSTPEHYCLTYFLGKENENIDQIIRSKGCVRINAGPREVYGPGEFIYLIRNAEAVFTDSFHASVFSILYGVPAYIYDRKDQYTSMNSRIATLLDKTGVAYQAADGSVYIEKNAAENETVKNNLHSEHVSFMEFLKSNITN